MKEGLPWWFTLGVMIGSIIFIAGMLSGCQGRSEEPGFSAFCKSHPGQATCP